MSVAIRDATPADDAALARLFVELGHDIPAEHIGARRERFVARDSGRVLVAEIDGVVMGFAAISITHPIQRERPVLHISALAVSPDARRRGVGRALLRAIEQAGRAAGCGHGNVTSAEHRAGAHAFYPAEGWALTGRRFGRALD